MFSERDTRRGPRATKWILGIVALALAAVPAVGQQSAPTRIAVIDVERILTDSDAGQQALEELKQLNEQKRGEIQAKTQEAASLRDEITEKRLQLSEERLSEMQKTLEDLAIEIERMRDDANREIEKRQTTAFDRIERRVLPIIDQVGREMGFTVIFNKFQSGLLFAQDEVDITDLILQRFDEESAAETTGSD